MKSVFFISLLLLGLPFTLFGQFKIEGIVTDRDKEALIGATILIKGTSIGTITDFDGTFQLEVPSEHSVLKISYTGFDPKEVKIKGRRFLKIKLDGCTKCWLDDQKIGFTLKSGILKTPFGGELRISTPTILRQSVFVGLNYQTNFEENQQIGLDLDILHFDINCDIDIDAHLNFQKMTYGQKMELNHFSGEGWFNWKKFRYIAGYHYATLIKNWEIVYQPSSGFTLGVGLNTLIPKRTFISIKAAIFKDFQIFEFQIKKHFRHFHGLIKYQQIDKYPELTIGIGTSTTYFLPGQK